MGDVRRLQEDAKISFHQWNNTSDGCHWNFRSCVTIQGLWNDDIDATHEPSQVYPKIRNNENSYACIHIYALIKSRKKPWNVVFAFEW